MGQRRAPVSCRGKRPSWWCIPMTACSAKGLWAVSFSSLAGKLWTLMGQLCEGPGVDTGGCDHDWPAGRTRGAVDDVKTIYCLPVRWGPGLSWGDTFRTPVVSERRQSWGAGVPRERLECSGTCLGPVCLEVLVGVRGGAVVYCWSGQGIAWSDLESLNKSGPQFELLCCWEKLQSAWGSDPSLPTGPP